MQQVNEKINALSPVTIEVAESIISGACTWFTVTREQLTHEHKLAYVRHLCFYLISVGAPGTFDYNIGSFLGYKRRIVRYGIDKIDSHKNYYGQVLADLNGIVGIANNFTKKYSWHLPLISTIR